MALEGRALVQAASSVREPAASTQVTERSRVPGPQATLHAPQAPVSQVAGAHGPALQLWLAAGAGGAQAESGCTPEGASHHTCRVWVPRPQVVLHAPKEVASQDEGGHAPGLQGCWVAGCADVHAPAGSEAPAGSKQMTSRV
jgi:hypothetical protein